ncbi:uncharacterized protein [Haliotis asinina]|uniref:uncharacterized protein n=1 Tax=Haliotis asinina TaxID=109174 RepID=UPI0035319A8C
MNNSFGISLILSLPFLSLTQDNICPSEVGENVVHICEKNFVSGEIFYLNTARGFKYEGNCVCQLTAHGAAIDLELSVHEVDKSCDATLYFSPPIDHMYNCADKSPPTVSGRIEPGQTAFISFFKPSPDVVADFCVMVAQTTTDGSMGLTCTRGKLRSDRPAPHADNTRKDATKDVAISAFVVSLVVVVTFVVVVVAIILIAIVCYCRERRRVRKLSISPINVNDHGNTHL